MPSTTQFPPVPGVRKPEAALTPTDDDDGLSPEAIDAALKQTPRGAYAIAGTAVGLLMLAWLAIYLFVFLPRGSVG